MNHKRTLARAVLLAAAVGLFAEQVLAAPTSTVIVTAPRAVHREQIGKANAGIPIEGVSLTRVVNISDLDLGKEYRSVAEALDLTFEDMAAVALDGHNAVGAPGLVDDGA